MADIIDGVIRYNEVDAKSNGGTELLARRLVENIPKEDLNGFQIVLSRKRTLENNKIRIFWAHDLPGDPESDFIKTSPNDFHIYVFVSNWQMQAYINHYNLPWSKCVVIGNFIDPIPAHEKPSDVINLTYFSTPHRGLNILVPVFKELAKIHPDIHLNVFSSFKLYGWTDSDAPFKPLFDEMSKIERITNYGTVSNAEMREFLRYQHILAYPCTWHETSCLVLMEAMSAGLFCVHPNYAALPETSARHTFEYQWHEDPMIHAQNFFNVMNAGINFYREKEKHENFTNGLKLMKGYADMFYNTTSAITHWKNFLAAMKVNIKKEDIPLKAKENNGEFFSYNTRK